MIEAEQRTEQKRINKNKHKNHVTHKSHNENHLKIGCFTRFCISSKKNTRKKK